MTEHTNLYDLWLASITDLSNKKKNSLLAVLASPERIYHAEAAELRATGMLRAKDSAPRHRLYQSGGSAISRAAAADLRSAGGIFRDGQ